ncbi:MAG: putative rane protein [Herbinix sp.]|nr:putative rane protein [Herbinix sp.]
MRQFRQQIHRLSIIQIAIILLILGLFMGVVFANAFKSSYDQQMVEYQTNIFSEITGNNIDYSGLFGYILAKNFGEFAIFWLLCITILGIPYMAYKIASFGFFTGFFISAVSMQFGVKGILLVLSYAFPHGLIYLPISVLCLYKGYELCTSIYHDKRNHISGLTALMKSKLAIILILAVALIIGSFLEAYAGAFLLKKTIGLFI